MLPSPYLYIKTYFTFLITDAGPLKLGYAIHNSEGVLLWYSSYTWPFVRNDNFQNAKEFLAFLVVLVELLNSGLVPDCCTIHWTGDNTSSLIWVQENRCKSIFTQRAFFVFSLLCLRRRISVCDVVHRPGDLMGAIDALSRDKMHDLNPHLFKDVQHPAIVDALLHLCDPILIQSATLDDHHLALVKVFDVVGAMS